ncbi:hypothetical protein N7468_006751 [Penicillium chermesinum]|uniref:Uncharacterized protein n=1 Tax=Penicillium chermesinum TaxID=63820 RepID=A0A9W9NST2_9EURO|nr:uncharacterized protein N7468_006751 [Penicillium chermesinum]KAJ5225526.1 hypothetical protein N7468_006751 [Penicillium chermesinum]
MSTGALRNLTRKGFLQPPEDSPTESTGRRAGEADSYRSQRISRSRVRFELPQEEPEDLFTDSNRRWANVYDACASMKHPESLQSQLDRV